MKDKHARVLAIVALVFMGIFIAALIATLVDYRLLNNSIGFIALASGVFVVMSLIALKADGRGFSMTKLNNQIEMEKIERELKEQAEKEQADKADDAAAGADSDTTETNKTADDSPESQNK